MTVMGEQVRPLKEDKQGTEEDGMALNIHEDVQILEDDSEKTQDDADGGGTGL